MHNAKETQQSSPMKFITTRDSTASYTFEQTLLLGICPAGGLFVPAEIPKLLIDSCQGSFDSTAFEISRLFISRQEISSVDLRRVVREAYASFDSPEVVEFQELDGDLVICELFHGSSLAFKDLAMAPTVGLIEYFLSKAPEVGNGSEVGNDGMGATNGYSIIGEDVAAIGSMNGISIARVDDVVGMGNDKPMVYGLGRPILGAGDVLDMRKYSPSVHGLGNPIFGVGGDGRVDVMGEIAVGKSKTPPAGKMVPALGKPLRATTTVLVSTSGDTGPSTLEATKRVPGVRAVVLFPEGCVSERQALQMTHRPRNECSHVFQVRNATSDSLDVVAFAMFADRDLVRKTNLCSLNSLNWSRIMFQITHYFYAYVQLKKKMNLDDSRKVVFSIPSGALGNAVAGLFAIRMGLPITLLLATNENDSVTAFLRSGLLSKNKGDVIKTISPAIDIQAPYNIERILWLATDHNCQLVKQWMETFERVGKVTIPKLDLLSTCVSGMCVTETQTLETIQRVWSDSKYLLDPHTAVGVFAAQNLRNDSMNAMTMVCLATAHPAKFHRLYLDKLRGVSERNIGLPKSLADLMGLPFSAEIVDYENLATRLRSVLEGEGIDEERDSRRSLL